MHNSSRNFGAVPHAPIAPAALGHSGAAVTVMPAEQFDTFSASLDVPDHAPTLSAAARDRAVFTRR